MLGALNQNMLKYRSYISQGNTPIPKYPVNGNSIYLFTFLPKNITAKKRRGCRN